MIKQMKKPQSFLDVFNTHKSRLFTTGISSSKSKIKTQSISREITDEISKNQISQVKTPITKKNQPSLTVASKQNQQVIKVQPKLAFPPLKQKQKRLRLTSVQNKQRKVLRSPQLVAQKVEDKASTIVKLLINPPQYEQSQKKLQFAPPAKKISIQYSSSEQKLDLLNKIQKQKYSLDNNNQNSIQNGKSQQGFSSGFCSPYPNYYFRSSILQKHKLNVCQVFNIKIISPIQKINNQCQVQFLNQKKLEDFAKFQAVFSSNIQQIEQKWKKQFSSQLPQNDDNQKIIDQILKKAESKLNISRQQRVVALDKEIQAATIQTQKIVEQFIDRQIETYQIEAQNYLRHQTKMDLILKKLTCSLTKVQKNEDSSIVTISGEDYSKAIKYVDKLQRQLSSKNYCQMDSQNLNGLRQISSKFDNWKSLLDENKVLIYNCVKKLQSIPEFFMSIFGKYKLNQAVSSQLSDEEKLKAYLSIKCLKCYETCRDIKTMQNKCEQSQPITKALQVLLKGPSQTSNFFALKAKENST